MIGMCRMFIVINTSKNLALVTLLVASLIGCGIRGAPIPPTKPNLYNQSYQEYIEKKESENEQKNKFRSGYSPNNTVQGE